MKIMSIKVLFPIIAMTMLMGCAGSKKAASDAVPQWFLTTPTEEGYIYASGTATSQDMQMAKDKAAAAARLSIGQQVETQIEALTSRFQEELGTGNDMQMLDYFTQASKAIVNTTLNGVAIDKAEIKSEAGLFRAFVLMKMPESSTSEELLNKLKNEDEMYTRFRASEMFKELEGAVSKSSGNE